MDEDIALLGSLSERYETAVPGAAGAGVISTGQGDLGGVSYGSYQLASRTGTVARFVEWIRARYPDLFQRLAGLRPATPGFNSAWKDLAARDANRFYRAQHAFIAATHYVPARDLVEEALRLGLLLRPRVLRDVLWSTAVQHGPISALRVWKRALEGRGGAAINDETLVRAVYGERGRTDADGKLVYFRGSSPEVQKAVARRFRQEREEALRRLLHEQAAQRASQPSEWAG